MKIQEGDIVRFNPDANEVYYYAVPETAEEGKVKVLTVDRVLLIALGVEMEMAMVHFPGSDITAIIYVDDLTFVRREEPDEIVQSLDSKLN